MSKNVTLQDKNGVQLYPATTAEQVRYTNTQNIKQHIDSNLQSYINTESFMLAFEKVADLNVQGIGTQGFCTDGDYFYYIDYYGDLNNSYLVKTNLNGGEITRAQVSTGHFNSLCYCAKDGYLYTANNAIQRYSRDTLTLVDTIQSQPTSIGNIAYNSANDVFIFNRVGTFEYYYMDYAHLTIAPPSILINLDLRLRYSFCSRQGDYVRQSCCFTENNYIFIIEDRWAYNKNSVVALYTPLGKKVAEVLTDTIGSVTEIQDVEYLNGYLYVATDSAIYKTAITTSARLNNSILYKDVNVDLKQNLYQIPGASQNIFYNPSVFPPTSVNTAVGSTYVIGIDGNNAYRMKMYYSIETQRTPIRDVEAIFDTNGTIVFNDVINYGSGYGIITLRASCQLSNGVLTVNEFAARKIIFNADGTFTRSNVSQFLILGFKLMY